MALFDLTLSLILVIGYLVLIVLIENTYSISLLSCMLLVLMLYKLAALPVAYLVSIVVESKLNGFFFILFIHFIIGWCFIVTLRTFIEWFLYNEGYVFIVAEWILLLFPLSSAIDALVDMNHIYRINTLCSRVPAFMATVNILPLNGPQTLGLTDKILTKVKECLANGKEGISLNVVHKDRFGILWDIYLILSVGAVTWIFLLFAEKVFVILARRFETTKTSDDPMKTVIRSNEPTVSLFRWNREKDRLVSEYIRCLNEAKYVKQMSTNCLYLRIWLRPLSDQSSLEKRIATILEPLSNLGQPRNELHIELKTTLQLFIRLGSESSRFKVDKVELIETYARFIKEHSETVVKFAVVDWTRENLYKILLHGHYNTKSISAIT